MTAKHAQRSYLCCLFILMASNGVTSALGSLGLHVAFYHLQGIVLLICAAQIATLLLRGRVELLVAPALFAAVAMSAAYSIVSGVLLLRFSDIHPAYVALMLHTNLFYPVTALLMMGIGTEVTPADRKTVQWLGMLSALIIVFGWVQFVLRSPIIDVRNSEDVSKLVESNILGTFRPPGVFSSSFEFGVFCVLMFCVGCGYVLFGQRTLCALILTALAGSGIIVSQTRNVYLFGICAATSMFLMWLGTKWKSSTLRLLGFTPLAYVLASVAVMYWAVRSFLSTSLHSTGDLVDASSTWARVSSWQAIWETLVVPGSPLDWICGAGIAQAGHASDFIRLYPLRADGYFIDSTYVQLFLFEGVAGLFAFLFVLVLVWRLLLTRVHKACDPLSAGVIAFVAAFPAAGVFNIMSGRWWGITLTLVFLVLQRRPVPIQSCPQ